MNPKEAFLKAVAQSDHSKFDSVVHLVNTATRNQALSRAAANGSLLLVERLLQCADVDVCVRQNEPFRNAASAGHLDVVDLLLSIAAVDPSAWSNQAIREASRNGYFEIVSRLLKHPAVDPSACNQAAVRWAARYGHLEVVNLLLNDDRVDASVLQGEAIREAVLSGHVLVVDRLLKDVRVASQVDLVELVEHAARRKQVSVLDRLFCERELDMETVLHRVSGGWQLILQRVFRARWQMADALCKWEEDYPTCLVDLVTKYVWPTDTAKLCQGESRKFRCRLNQLKAFKTPRSISNKY
eukprot:TRINITY_DN13413_c0_g1_i4.p1 TRINITY_DN13413_c0_g1~~TRINITY_DN13413_c0_g1_i4.p1  ORF type:complete len:298 (-),score=7.25 TRINITY_DN13413_c0_g1_i4:31-924(-)